VKRVYVYTQKFSTAFFFLNLHLAPAKHRMESIVFIGSLFYRVAPGELVKTPMKLSEGELEDREREAEERQVLSDKLWKGWANILISSRI